MNNDKMGGFSRLLWMEKWDKTSVRVDKRITEAPRYTNKAMQIE